VLKAVLDKIPWIQYGAANAERRNIFQAELQVIFFFFRTVIDRSYTPNMSIEKFLADPGNLAFTF
jgi:hypothetical protein